MARPRFIPTPQQRQTVEMMAAIGIPQEEMCRVVINPEKHKPIGLETLNRCFRLELDTGATKATMQVGGALFKSETKDGNVTAQIFWMKTRAKWRETSVHEHQGPGGGPMQIIDAAAVAKLSDDELAAFERICAKLAGESSGDSSGEGTA